MDKIAQVKEQTSVYKKKKKEFALNTYDTGLFSQPNTNSIMLTRWMWQENWEREAGPWIKKIARNTYLHSQFTHGIQGSNQREENEGIKETQAY